MIIIQSCNFFCFKVNSKDKFFNNKKKLMFKIESLLTPWLLGYLDEYIKFRPEDFKL
jgi:hypothetical protein